GLRSEGGSEVFMAEEKLGLHVDNDWKKQAQEEKRKLAEQEEKRKTAATAPAGVVPGAAGGGGPPSGPAGARQAAGRGAGQGQGAQREIPQASFATLVQSLLTQVLFYLGDLSTRGGEPMVNLDMAKHNIDTLSIIEDKTQNNLTDEEKRL